MVAQNHAETLALHALAWLVGHDELRPVFLGASGLTEADLRTRAEDPDLHVAVLDFLMMDDAWVMAFCDSRAMAYDSLARARAALPGGGEVHWT